VLTLNSAITTHQVRPFFPRPDHHAGANRRRPQAATARQANTRAAAGRCGSGAWRYSLHSAGVPTRGFDALVLHRGFCHDHVAAWCSGGTLSTVFSFCSRSDVLLEDAILPIPPQFHAAQVCHGQQALGSRHYPRWHGFRLLLQHWPVFYFGSNACCWLEATEHARDIQSHVSRVVGASLTIVLSLFIGGSTLKGRCLQMLPRAACTLPSHQSLSAGQSFSCSPSSVARRSFCCYHRLMLLRSAIWIHTRC
jgi:hypothetical protein